MFSLLSSWRPLTRQLPGPAWGTRLQMCTSCGYGFGKRFCFSWVRVSLLFSATDPLWPHSDVCVCVDWQLVSPARAHTWQAGETFQLRLFGLRLLRGVRQQQPSLPELQPESGGSPGSSAACQHAAGVQRQQGGINASLMLVCLLRLCTVLWILYGEWWPEGSWWQVYGGGQRNAAASGRWVVVGPDVVYWATKQHARS